MARHKHKNPRVKVYFQYRGRYFRLLEAINFGTKNTPELKIKGLTEIYLQTKDDQHRFDGKFHVGQLIRFIDGKNVEFTYHKDGSILTEVIHPSGLKEYNNPYGKDERWTPIADITTYQPVMIFQILSQAHYLPAFIEEKYGLKNYIIKNDHLFEFQRGQGIMVLVYMKHKDFPLAKYCFDGMNYSDVLMQFGENHELCIFIQKQLNPDNTGSTKNNFTFVDRLDGYEYMSSILKNHIFDKTFADFMDVVQKGGCYFDISEKMMQVMESVDPLYNQLLAEKMPVQIHKPELIRMLLDKLDGKYDEYLDQTEEERMKYVTILYLNGVMARCEEVRNFIETNHMNPSKHMIE